MSNLQHLATDCPQRGERLGWMNDATVRFEETAYNFNTNRLFRKISADVMDEQDKKSGAITCTAPYVGGSRPADPVCSSYLVLGLENLIHYGDTDTIGKHYESYKKWNECLSALRNAEGIVEYAHYGDWASPKDSCTGGFDAVKSAVTDPYLMSTGYHYLNSILLARFAEALGKTDEQKSHLEYAEDVRRAIIKKWFDPRDARIGSGSQGSQAFALWLGVIPKEHERRAAKRMLEAVESVGYRITTGNLTTKYLLDMLAKYGYEDAAWKLLCREEYPSWGYMIQHGATTVWERFEQKRGSVMNSHSHPMYGAVGYWLYAYLLGIKPQKNGYEEFEIAPVFPKGLHYAEGRVSTTYGDIYLCWRREVDHLYITIDVPFGTKATLRAFEETRDLESGVYHFSFEDM
jgi:alpha-L-rhamnosidase